MHARRGGDERKPQLLAERLQYLLHVRGAVDIHLGVEGRADRACVA